VGFGHFYLGFAKNCLDENGLLAKKSGLLAIFENKSGQRNSVKNRLKWAKYG